MSVESAETVGSDESDEALPQIVGIGIIFISRALSLEEPVILTAEETQSRDVTGKTRGERAIIQETIKVEPTEVGVLIAETPDDTLLGGLAEIVGQKDVDAVGSNFHRVAFGPEHNTVATMPSIGKRGRVEVLVYDGPSGHPFEPLIDEMREPEWMTVPTVLGLPNLRPTSRELVNHADRQGLLSYGLDQYARGKMQPVFGERVDLGKFYQRRELKPDITIFRR
jgi:hypothetical protein